MAKVSAHGREIGTLYYVASAKRYMSDGVVLKNIGFGWKIHGKVKPEFTPQQAFEKAAARQREMLAKYPANAAYRKELHDLTGMCNRWKLHACVAAMPNDPDGVWSDACDGYGDSVHADIGEVVKLCRLYEAAVAESKDETRE